VEIQPKQQEYSRPFRDFSASLVGVCALRMLSLPTCNLEPLKVGRNVLHKKQQPLEFGGIFEAGLHHLNQRIRICCSVAALVLGDLNGWLGVKWMDSQN
jgi:hypothetical protein